MFDVACVGVLVADTVVKTVDRLPGTGKLAVYDNISLYSGGCASNAAIDLAKLGAGAAIVGMVGRDGFGGFLKSELQKYGVDTRGLRESGEASTSASVAMIDGCGERSFLHSYGANGVFRERDVDYSVIDESRIVFVAGCMLMPSFDGEDCATVLEYSREHGKITALDTAWDDKGRWMKTLAPCMNYIDYFMPSINEAQLLSGKETPRECAEEFFKMGVGSVVIKLGSDGCYYQKSISDEGVFVPTYKSFAAVDTTGAGDSFCAGFLFGLSRGMDILDCCMLGNAVGTHCVMAVGSSTGIRSYEETVRFMRENQIDCSGRHI
jgi:sugar/nucleoside kinase (ribokinase family)